MRDQVLDVLAELLRPERAVEADDQRLGVADAVQNASTVWPDSVRPEASVMVPEMIDRQPEAQLLEQPLDREDRGLGVERVEDRLDEQQVGAAGDQAAAASW